MISRFVKLELISRHKKVQTSALLTFADVFVVKKPYITQLAEDEALIGCVHFHKEIYNTHGIPTLVKVKTGESFANIRDRIQNYLEISQETFDKYKVAVIFNGQVGWSFCSVKN